MGAQEDAIEANKINIAIALSQNSLILKAAETGNLSATVANKIISDLGTSGKVSELQTVLSHVGLSEVTIKAQQELSDLFVHHEKIIHST